MKPRPLLLLGHAQGGTSTTYRLALRATGLAGWPKIQHVGEVLNRDRFPGRFPFPHFQPAGQRKALAIVDRVLRDCARRRLAVKDVMQPWLLGTWLRENPDVFRVLVVLREPRDVLATRLKNRPNRPPHDSHCDVFQIAEHLAGLAGDVDGQIVRFPDVITDPAVLQVALGALGYLGRPFAFDQLWHARRRKKLAAVAEARERFAGQIEQLARGRE